MTGKERWWYDSEADFLRICRECEWDDVGRRITVDVIWGDGSEVTA